jgi:hypothetical protein
MTPISELQRVLRLPSIPTLALYAATLVAEVPVVFTRMLLALAITAVVLLVKGESPAGAESLVELALIPTGWSILALLTPFGGGWWWRSNMGGRDPSERERSAYHDAVQLLQAHAAEPLRLPSLWFVTDEPQPDAAVCGETLMLSRGLLETEQLPAVLAHELGHLAAIEQIAQRVAQLLRHERLDTEQAPEAPTGLVDAGQLARQLGLTRAWVYQHAAELGAIRVGRARPADL